MRASQKFRRMDTLGLKAQIIKKLGRQKAEKYFLYLKRFLSMRVSRLDFEKFIVSVFGQQDILLHNLFIRSILRNAYLACGPPSVLGKVTTAAQLQGPVLSNPNLGVSLPISPWKGSPTTGNRDWKLNNMPSPLGPYGKMVNGAVKETTNSCDPQRSREHQSAVELVPIGSQVLLEVASVEDGEEVDQVSGSPCVQKRSPIRAPLGLSIGSSGSCKSINHRNSFGFCISSLNKLGICQSCSELPSTMDLQKQIKHIAEREGLGLNVDCVNLLNCGLDVYLKRLIKPCLELAKTRQCLPNASLLDFRVVVESNPQLLGADWPTKLEKLFMS